MDHVEMAHKISFLKILFRHLMIERICKYATRACLQRGDGLCIEHDTVELLPPCSSYVAKKQVLFFWLSISPFAKLWLCSLM